MIPPWLQPPGPYAGIGARKSPPDVLDLMVRIGTDLARRGFTLRSGAAEGADTAFEVGAIHGGGRMGIWLPWAGFEQSRLRWAGPMNWRKILEDAAGLPTTQRRLFPRATPEAEAIASRTHPRWAGMMRPTRALMSRNVQQALGQDCRTPSRFAICWTEDGATTPDEVSDTTGGTGMAIRVCSGWNPPIPVFNLRREDHRRMWEALVG